MKKNNNKKKDDLLNYKKILDDLPQCVDIVDENLNIIYMNKVFLKKFGQKSIGKKCYEVYKIDKKQCTNCSFKEKLKVGQSRVLEVEGIVGGRIYSITHKIISLNGKKAALEIFEDITEKKQVEESLGEINEKFSTLATSAPVGIYMTDAKGDCVYVNRMWIEISGIGFKKALGDGWVSAIHPDDKKKVFTAWSLFAKGKVPFEIEYRFKTPKGKVSWVFGRATNLKDKSGKITGYIGTIQDITEKKKTEEALKESEERYRLIYETSSDAIMTLEPPSWKFTSGNKSIIKMFGVKNEKEFTSLPPWKLSPEYQPDGQLSSTKAKKMIKKAVTAGSNFFEWTHKKLHGEEFFATVLLNRVESEGGMFLHARVQDINEKKIAEIKLMKSEQEYRSLFENTNDLIQSVNPSGNFLYVNNAWKKRLGYSEEETKKMNVWKIIHPDEIDHCKNTFGKLLKGQNINFIQTKFVGKKGNIVDVEGNIFVKKNGPVSATQGFFRDVTEKNKVEKELKDFVKIFEDSLNEIYIFDAKSLKFLVVNRGARENMGYSMEELSKITSLGIKPEFTRKSFAKLVEPLREKKEEIIEFETIHKRKDGSFYNVEVHLQLSKLGDKEVFVAIILDITEKRVADAVLKESEKRFRSLMENSPFSVELYDTKGNWLEGNKAWEKLWGLKPKDALGKFNILKDKQAKEKGIVEYFKEALAGNTVRLPELNYDAEKSVGKGRARWLLSSFYPLRDKDGRVQNVVINHVDITKRKEAEEKVKGLDEVKNRFIETVSHQLRTPVTEMRWGLDLLIKGTVGKGEEEREEFLKKIYESGGRVTDMLDDLLVVLNIEEGLTQIREKKLYIEDLWKGIVGSYKEQAEQKKIIFRYISPKKPLPPISVDADKIRQVFNHLVNNAIDYTKEGGVVTTKLLARNGHVRFEVKDTGVGIPKDEQSRIFTRFYRASNAAVMVQNQSGIGLAISKYYIEGHGGKIGFNSVEGEGSKFWFEIPIKGIEKKIDKKAT